jgi:ABC-type uncharacterized transport system involved in gliding motility auxiliary subunit
MALKIERARLAAGCFLLGLIALLGSGVKYLFDPVIDGWLRGGVVVAVAAGVAGVLLDPARVRQALSGRQARYGGNAVLFGVGFLGILVVINALAVSYPQRIDLTEDKEFSLSPETELLLSELSEPVKLTGFYTPDRASARDQIRPLLDEFVSKSNGLVSYEFIDPRSNPLAADLFGVTRDASMAATLGEDSHLIEFPSEREITSAIVRLTNPEDRVVYFLTGHGELELEETGEIGLSQLKSSLESKNYGVQALNLLVEGEVPGDASVVIAAAPRTQMTEQELQLINDYLVSGGSLIIMLEPSAVTQLDLADDSLNSYLLENWGVGARDDFVVDLGSSLYLVGLSFSYGTHPITERVSSFLTQYPSARSIEISEAADPARTITQLVMTSERSWGETDFAAIAEGSTIQFDEQIETSGPLVLAAALEDSQSGARLVVFGDGDFASNGGFFAGGNGDLMVNSVDWAARQEDLIDITPRQRTVRQVLPATRSTVTLLVFGTTVVIPGGIVLAGGWVWWNRRKRS